MRLEQSAVSDLGGTRSSEVNPHGIKRALIKRHQPAEDTHLIGQLAMVVPLNRGFCRRIKMGLMNLYM